MMDKWTARPVLWYTTMAEQ